MVEGAIDTAVSAGERFLYAVFDGSMPWEEKLAYAFALDQMLMDFTTGVVIGEILDWLTAGIQAKMRQAYQGGTGSKFQEVFDLADNYKLSDDTFNNHILDRHGPNSTYGNKSHFNADFDIKDGIDSTLKGDNFIVGPNTAGRDGYIFEQTFTSPIGTNSKGKPLYTLKVVIDEWGNVVTAFPKT